MKGDETSATPVIRRTARVVSCPPVQTNVRWPAPVDQRLNELVSLLNMRGHGVTRSQLLAALVACTVADPEHLSEIITEYFDKTAGAVVLQPQGGIKVGERQPGRRRSSSL